MFVTANPVHAHIALSQTRFESGANFAAFFKIEHGCDGSPTISLRVQIPDGVLVLETPDKPGWTLSAERVPLSQPVRTERGEMRQRVVSVTWRGKLDAKAADQFGLFVKLPATTGPLYFPAIQQCERGETRWTDIPARGQAWRDVPHPAPVVELVAAAATHYMAGSIMIDQPWSPATPPGAKTAAAYMTIMNHGSTADTLLGGSTPVAATLEIHETSTTGGVMSMRAVPRGLTVPAGSTVSMIPRAGYHFMLTGLKAPLKQGARIPATLNFAKAGAVNVEFVVAAIGAQGLASGPPMDHR
jgi:hypothetical protein